MGMDVQIVTDNPSSSWTRRVMEFVGSLEGGPRDRREREPWKGLRG